MSDGPTPEGRALAPESLTLQLQRRIAAQGPISVAEYMRVALADPEQGYYRTRDPLGRGGDFVTAPECSQIFGELIGLWAAHVWGLIGQPGKIQLIELGPGRGTLMADALRACRRAAPRFVDSLTVHLVETSSVLRAAQAQALAGYDVQWHDRFDDIPIEPAILIANEFLDALPIHQLVRGADGVWLERQVGLDAEGALIFTQSDEPSPLSTLLPATIHAGADAGAIAEVAPEARAVIESAARHAVQIPIVALFIDYGYSAPGAGDSLQAIRDHAYHPALSDPGEADLTAHVDFWSLAQLAGGLGAEVQGPVTQRDFLIRLGAVERAEKLLAQASPSQAASIRDGLDRLIHPGRMGHLFKVLALGPPGLSPLPGFVP